MPNFRVMFTHPIFCPYASSCLYYARIKPSSLPRKQLKPVLSAGFFVGLSCSKVWNRKLVGKRSTRFWSSLHVFCVVDCREKEPESQVTLWSTCKTCKLEQIIQGLSLCLLIQNWDGENTARLTGRLHNMRAAFPDAGENWLHQWLIRFLQFWPAFVHYRTSNILKILQYVCLDSMHLKTRPLGISANVPLDLNHFF